MLENCSNICILREEIVHCGVAWRHQILLSFWESCGFRIPAYWRYSVHRL